jgi:hypothetical protein
VSGRTIPIEAGGISGFRRLKAYPKAILPQILHDLLEQPSGSSENFAAEAQLTSIQQAALKVLDRLALQLDWFHADDM